jgi:hypothetical protein
MADYTARPTNGVSYGIKHTLVAGDVSDGVMTFDFQNSIDLVAVVQLTSSGVVVDPSGMIITYPEAGKISIEDGTVTWTADDVIEIILQRASVEV